MPLDKVSDLAGRTCSFYSPQGPGTALVPGGRRLVKNACRTTNKRKTARTTYTGRSKERNAEEDEINNIMKMDGAFDVKVKRGSISCRGWNESSMDAGEEPSKLTATQHLCSTFKSFHCSSTTYVGSNPKLRSGHCHKIMAERLPCTKAEAEVYSEKSGRGLPLQSLDTRLDQRAHSLSLYVNTRALAGRLWFRLQAGEHPC